MADDHDSHIDEPMAEHEDIGHADHDTEIIYRIDITPKLVYSILAPFIWNKFREQLKAVLPISAFLFIFQLAVLRQGIEDAIGLVVVILGIMFFMEGLRLTPLGEIIGATLPQKARMWVIMAFAVVLGVSVTLAEPAIASLKQAGAGIQASSAPLLFDLLNDKSTILVGAVGLGVGIATSLGVYRFALNWSLKVLLLPTFSLALILTVFLQLMGPETRAMIALAWDTGAVTTGPITVPLVLAMGLGIGTAVGVPDGFGMLAMASIGPILSVLIMGLYVSRFSSAEEAPELWIPLDDDPEFDLEPEPAQ